MEKIIAFDMDGTILDSLGLTIDAMCEAVAQITGSKPVATEITRYFGHTEDRIFKLHFGEEKGKAATQAYTEIFSKRLSEVVLFEGIKDMLEAIRTLGHNMALYTARGRGTTDILLDHFDLHQYFDFILTGSEVENGKPNPEGLKKIASHFNQPENNLIYIGDSHKDIQMAIQVNGLGYAVTWCGHAKITELEKVGPDETFEKPKELQEHLLSKFNRFKK